MLIQRLKELDYNFSKLPSKILESLNVYNEVVNEMGTNADQQLSEMDEELFYAIYKIDPDNNDVITAKEEHEFKSNYEINDSFNTTGLIQLDDEEMNEIKEVNKIADVNSSAEKLKFENGGLITAGKVLSLMARSQKFALADMDDNTAEEVLADLKRDLEKIPEIGGQDGEGKNAVAYLHYFTGSSDWYITEMDPKTKEAFGFAILNGNYLDASFGYIDINEIIRYDFIELDLYWTPKTINEILEKVAPELVSEPIKRYKVKEDNYEYFQGTDHNYKNPFVLNKAIEEFLATKSSNVGFTENELKFIDKYTGYGGLSNMGDLDDEKLQGLKYEYYTPDEVIKKMWALAYKYGYGSRISHDVVEPSVGTGMFFKYAPKEGKKVGFEVNTTSARICKILYPDVQLKVQPFEKHFIKRNLSVKGKVQDLEKFSLCIGNPPYGKINSFYFNMGEDNYTKAPNYAQYFISRGLDLLHSGGLLIYIVGAEQMTGGTLFLDSKPNKAKELIHEKAELIDAYRLPAKIFERTGVSSEILVFKKR